MSAAEILTIYVNDKLFIITINYAYINDVNIHHRILKQCISGVQC